MVTSAEHEYTRFGYRELIERKAVDILQAKRKEEGEEEKKRKEEGEEGERK